ncbi:MAG: AI-2E family transporter, partial [Alphaproteobacteria bacterium]|nr:AI-2E family transporter [Alphaproteobacteria bacterium]
TVILAFLVIFGTGSLIGSQLGQLAENLPQYQVNVTAKIHSLRGSAAESDLVGRASGMLKDLTDELGGASPPAGRPANRLAASRDATARQAPVPVEVRQPDPTALQVLQAVIAPLLQPLATTGIVIVFLVFFLLQREDLRGRFIRLAGGRDLNRTTRALDDAGHRLSRYLLAQTAINAGFGVVIGIGLWIIGIPNPALWGILAMVLRFVPYIGAIIAAIFPAILALAVDPGWTMLAWTVALFFVVEPITGQIVEPLLYGHSTGLSAVAVVVAAAFWTWLWGPVGLLLSTPLTLCLVVVGRHVEHLEFFDILLGDRPALSIEENFYQRMLANDPDEAAHLAEDFLKSHSIVEYYDEVAIKGLALAQMDVNRGVLDHDRRAAIRTAVEDVIDALSDHAPAASADPISGAAPADSCQSIDPAWRARAVLCVAGRGSLDEAAAAMLAQLINRQGIGAEVASNAAVSPGRLTTLDPAGVQVVCLSYLEAGGFGNARFLVRRMRRQLPRATIVVGFWTSDEAAQRDVLRDTGADALVTSLAEAVALVMKRAEPRSSESAPPALASAPSVAVVG